MYPEPTHEESQRTSTIEWPLFLFLTVSGAAVLHQKEQDSEILSLGECNIGLRSALPVVQSHLFLFSGVVGP